MRLVTSTIPTKSIQLGMTIVEYPKIGRGKPVRIEVKEVVHSACSSRNTHVNGNLCYDRAGEVDVLVGTEKSPDEMDVKELAKYLGIPEELVVPLTPEERLMRVLYGKDFTDTDEKSDMDKVAEFSTSIS